VPHIFTCLLSYLFFLQGTYFSGKCLLGKKNESENEAYRLVCLGFPLLTAGIVIGSVWAASAWGSWWSWDPKETFSLAVWFVYFAFIIFRKFYDQNFLRSNCLWNIAAFVMIIIGVTIVNFSKLFSGLHNYSK
jgi:ABC-type transport system involved in cytochrome c biogenesis permease subunit